MEEREDPALRAQVYPIQLLAADLRRDVLATQLVRDKIIACQATLQTFPESRGRGLVLRKLDNEPGQFREVPDSIETLGLVDARAALIYFAYWRKLPLRREGTGQRPVPPEWHRIGRQPLVSGSNRLRRIR
jgi:hypothetical protein